MKTLVLGEGKYKVRYNDKGASLDEGETGRTCNDLEFSLVQEVERVTEEAYKNVWEFIEKENVDLFKNVVGMREKIPKGQDWKLICTLLESLKVHNANLRKALADQASKEILTPKKKLIMP